MEPAAEITSLIDLAAALTEFEQRYAELARAANTLDKTGEWALDGSTSMVAWLRSHLRMLDRDAHELLRHGRFLGRFPTFADAITESTLSLGQTVAMRRVTRPRHEAVLAEQQHAMVEILAPLQIRDTVHAVRVWRQRADAILDGPEPTEAGRELAMAVDEQGCAHGRFTLSPAATNALEHALKTATTYDGDHDTRTAGERRADALHDICAFFNANHTKPGTPRHRPHIDLVKNPDGTATTIDGDPVDPACAAALSCDCVIHRVLRAGSSILDYGRATRSVPLPTFRAVAIRDGGCRFPGCCRPVAWTEAHHITHWDNGGPTNPDNLVLLCSRHHHLIHRPGWRIEMLPDATVRVTGPDQLVRTSRPPGVPPDFAAA